MEIWIIHALLAMLFAGLTAVLAKLGLANIHADLGLGIRTTVIFTIVVMINLVTRRYNDLALITGRQIALLVASGITTTFSWLFYYRAIKVGPVSYVAAIDKGSILVTFILSFALLGEAITPRVLAGGSLILAGMLVLIWK